MKKKVIAAGHICLDITPVFPGKKVDQLTDILSPGKLLNVNEADVHTGGSVKIQVIAISAILHKASYLIVWYLRPHSRGQNRHDPCAIR